ncbi:hypothetical protein TIFTF001_052640 [Ficus carica]|uniref:Uncharacterized protein n=1 Tax=Ficus carica TaxID=3494 RepID=A0AA88JES8_FICCA|nr:hypothetical protein TIFTF001_052640 [Ficus carica]
MGGRISWVARSGGDGRTLRGLNLIGQKNFGTHLEGRPVVWRQEESLNQACKPMERLRNGRKFETPMEGRIGCTGSQGGVRKKLESKLENQHPSSRGKPWP